MKKVYIILCITVLAHMSIHTVSASEYTLYESRVEDICESDPYHNISTVYDTEKYLEASEYLNIIDTKENAAFEVLETVKSQYRDNIGTIYSCAMIQTQNNALDFISKKLLKFDTSGKVEGIMKSRIDTRKNRLETAGNTLNCSDAKNETIYDKRNILGNTSSETCKYVTYLEYLREYYTDIPNILGLDTKDTTDGNNNNINDVDEVIEVYSTSEISRLVRSIDIIINEEIEHTYKIFPIAAQAYNEYENNYPLHFLLEVIREDFVLLRRGFHESLMPIAQVGYKIINAMIQ